MDWRWIGWGAAGLAVFAGLGVLMMDRIAGPMRAEDPLTVSPPKTSNWALALPPGVDAAGRATTEAPVWMMGVEELLSRFRDSVVREGNVSEIVADEAADLAFVQRSKFLRFPDVVSVRAVDLGAGRTSLALYSRSMIGDYDWGVNGARVERWLRKFEAGTPALR